MAMGAAPLMRREGRERSAKAGGGANEGGGLGGGVVSREKRVLSLRRRNPGGCLDRARGLGEVRPGVGERGRGHGR